MYINQTPKLASDLVVPKSGRSYVQTSKDSSGSGPAVRCLLGWLAALYNYVALRQAEIGHELPFESLLATYLKFEDVDLSRNKTYSLIEPVCSEAVWSGCKVYRTRTFSSGQCQGFSI